MRGKLNMLERHVKDLYTCSNGLTASEWLPSSSDAVSEVVESAAKMLLAEHHANEARKALLRQDAERRAVEADQLQRASIWKGLPAEQLPVGVSASAAMLQAVHHSQPKRRTPLEEALSDHPMQTADES
jgi:hypothetical protein